MTERCYHATLIQRFTWDGYLGKRLVDIEDTWNCSLCLKECNGSQDPGCGRFEVRTKVIGR